MDDLGLLEDDHRTFSWEKHFQAAEEQERQYPSDHERHYARSHAAAARHEIAGTEGGNPAMLHPRAHEQRVDPRFRQQQLQQHPLPGSLGLPPSDPLLGHLELPGSYLDPAMHRAPVAAGHGHRSDAHVNRQGPNMPRARPARPTGQHAPAQHPQHSQPLINRSAKAQEPHALAGTMDGGPEASAAHQASARAPAVQRKKADDSGTDTDEDGDFIAKARQAAAQEKLNATSAPTVIGKKRGAGSGKPRAGGITLKLLIDEGILEPGENVLTVEYKSSMTSASLAADGRIHCAVAGRTMTFESPSAFSIFLKRLVNPARKADDGWKTVKYNGRFLEQFKLELARRRLGMRSDEGNSGERPPQNATPPEAKKPRMTSLNDAGMGAAQSNGGAHQAPAPAAPRRAASPESPSSHIYIANGHGMANQSEYAKNRPKRQIKPPANLLLSSEEEHQMVPCTAYRGAPGSGGPMAQPFRVAVHSHAQLIMDFHSHLCASEVIGVLGGSWDADSRLLRVLRAVPVREISIEDGSINVEMDPEDQFKAVQRLEQMNMQCIGWYHSHPHFAAHPSIIDIKNQVNQQHQYRVGTEELYIAGIVSPYDDQAHGDVSAFTWFHVAHEVGRIPGPDQDPLQAGCRPMALQVDPMDDVPSTDDLQDEMQQLAERYARMASRVKLDAPWRNMPTRTQKLCASLEAHMPASWPVGMRHEFLNRAQSMLTDLWQSIKPPKKRRDKDEDVEISGLTEDAAGTSGGGEEAVSRGRSSGSPLRRHSPAEDRPTVSSGLIPCRCSCGRF